MLIFAMLISLALAGALLAGLGMGAGKGRSWVHLRRIRRRHGAGSLRHRRYRVPRLGLFRVDAVDRVLVELRESMQ